MKIISNKTEALKELKRVCKKRIIISLPDVNPFFFIRFHKLRRILPFLWRGFSLPRIISFRISC